MLCREKGFLGETKKKANGWKGPKMVELGAKEVYTAATWEYDRLLQLEIWDEVVEKNDKQDGMDLYDDGWG